MKKFLNRKILLLIMILSLLLTGCGKENIVEDTNYKNGVSFFNENKYSLALQEFKNSINSNPGNTDSYLKAAEILKRKKQYDEALSILDGGKNFAVEPYAIYQEIGEIYLIKKDYPLAEASFRESLNKNTQEWESEKALATALILQGKYDEARSSLENFDTLEKRGMRNAKYLLAILNYSDFDKALIILDSANINLSEDRDFKNLYDKFTEAKNSQDNKIEDFMNISYVVMNGDNFAFAIPILEEVVRESEYYLEAQQRLGHIYLKLEEYEKSNEYLLRALSLDYTNLETLTFLAQNYVDLKLEKEALDIYGTLLRIDGQNQEVRRDYVGALLLFNKMDKAKEQALILVGIDTSLTNRLILSEILVSLEDFQGADRELTFIIQSEEYKDITDPIKARVLALRGWVLFKLDQKAVGYETLEESFMFSSTQAETYLYIGLIQKDNQNLVGAKQSLERAIDLDFEGDVSFFAAEEIDKLGI